MSQKPTNHSSRQFGRGGRLTIELTGNLKTSPNLLSSVLSRKGMKKYLEDMAKLLESGESTKILLSSFVVKHKQHGKYVDVQTSPEGDNTVFVWTNNGTQVLTGKLVGKNIFQVNTIAVSALRVDTAIKSESVPATKPQQELQFDTSKCNLKHPRWDRLSPDAKEFRKKLLAELGDRETISRTAVDEIAFAVHPFLSEVSLVRTHWFMPYVSRTIPVTPGAPFHVNVALLQQEVASDIDDNKGKQIVSSDTNPVITHPPTTCTDQADLPSSQEEIVMTSAPRPESQSLVPIVDLLTQIQGASSAKAALKGAEQELANEEQALEALVREEEALQAQLAELARRKSECQESIDAQKARIDQLSEQSSINIPLHLKEEMRNLANAMLQIANQ